MNLVPHLDLVQKQTGYAEAFDGTSIYYETRGEGHPLFFCYGIVCTTNHWRHQLRYFSQHYKTIVMDFRGHHKTGKPQRLENLSIECLARDIQSVMTHLKIPKASFIGHSFGIPVMIRAFDMYPEMFDAFVAVNGFARNPMRGASAAILNRAFFESVRKSYELLPETLNYLWRFAVNNPLAMRISALAGGFNLNLTSLRDLEIYGRGVAAVDLDVFVELFNDMLRYDGRPVLERIRVPALVIGGTLDSVTPLPLQREIHEGIAGSEMLVVPYGTHCTQLDMPDLVNLKIEQFLRDKVS